VYPRKFFDLVFSLPLLCSIFSTMEISYYLKRPNAEKETALFARISWEGHQIKYYIPEKVNPKFWSKENQRAKETKKFPEYPEFNTRLEKIASDIRTCYRTLLNNNGGLIPNPETFKKVLDSDLKKKEPEKGNDKTLFGFFQSIIDQTKNGGRVQSVSGKPYSKATIQVYNNTLNRLKVFQTTRKRPIDFDTIDLDFYTDFTEYLSKRLILPNKSIGLSTNTIGKDIKILKVVMNEATERGINTNLQYRSRKFSTTSEQTDSIYLSEKELKEIEELDLSKRKNLDNVRDLFLIGCTGLRFSDFSILNPEQLKDGFIEIKEQTKTGQPIVIPIHPTVSKIVEKYNGELPKSITNQKTNEYLKEIGKLVKSLEMTTAKTYTKGGVKITKTFQKWELLTTHTARRSFATNEYLAGTPSITIMAITGHRTEKAFLKYIKLTPTEHAKLLKTHWDQRSKLKVV
jgi:Phage integrase SAM-like domain/Phage integrase family